MDERTTEFLRASFRQYYFGHSEEVEVPPRSEAREFGFTAFGGTMIRHLSFKGVGELRAMLIREGPHSVYSSAAYYQDPTLSMEEKGWMGADLIIDIDADLLKPPCTAEHNFWVCEHCGLASKGGKPELCPSCQGERLVEEKWVCSECLRAAKADAIKVLDFLQADLGIAQSQIEVYYSGNRGFHLVARSEDLLGLDQAARVEVANYLLGRGFTLEAFGALRRSPLDEVYRRLPREGEPGWRGRLARYFSRIIQPGKRVQEELAELYVRVGYEAFKQRLQEAIEELAAHIDPAVSTDLHRLLRLPATLHGETGLLKKRCENIEEFDPMDKAVVFGEEPITVSVDRSPIITLGGKKYGPFTSTVLQLPKAVAVYLCAKGAAKVMAQS